jgi:hypothetical protein
VDEPSPERAPAPSLAMWLYGLTMLLAGLFLLCAAAGLVSVSDGLFNAPRWLVGAVGLLITGGGAYIVAMPGTTPEQRAVWGGALALGFFTVMGASLTWVVLANVAGRGTLSVAGIPIPLPEAAGRWLNRLLVALFALLMDGLALFGWWRVLTGRWRPLVSPPSP